MIPFRFGYIGSPDINIVLRRIPERFLERVGEINLTAESKGVRQLGYVTSRGRRDITICSYLPPRVSLRRFMYGGNRAEEFGAFDRGQWPPWAIRRKLLYDTLLHEIGHLQTVRASPRINRRFADETLARQFAADMRGELYSQAFEHTDPVHNAPTDEELAMRSCWDALDKQQRWLVGSHVVELRYRSGVLDVPMSDGQRAFVERCVRPPGYEPIPMRLRSHQLERLSK